MDFQTARSRLLRHVQGLVRNGEVTERGLARLAGISQPHLHNVLKGVRAMTPETGDLLLATLKLDLLDLFEPEVARCAGRKQADGAAEEAAGGPEK